MLGINKPFGLAFAEVAVLTGMGMFIPCYFVWDGMASGWGVIGAVVVALLSLAVLVVWVRRWFMFRRKPGNTPESVRDWIELHGAEYAKAAGISVTDARGRERGPRVEGATVTPAGVWFRLSAVPGFAVHDYFNIAPLLELALGYRVTPAPTGPGIPAFEVLIRDPLEETRTTSFGSPW